MHFVSIESFRWHCKVDPLIGNPCFHALKKRLGREVHFINEQKLIFLKRAFSKLQISSCVWARC
jgi:hypothetical protein